ncbi:hypothetical protein LOC67_12265 [Stieleria sp. JC731]|uniref:lipopolysaccharide biosynthesis protein n=1 Tax=Pirellulaceae TaxID=2691357 RepID=UPI001E3E190B|nr:hypothetical protein [Stieleria sp. JC731]MCC9601322.1 hypothetical protein [Stieleria sp. JC731]
MDRLSVSREENAKFSTSIAGILIGANISGVALSYLLMLYLARSLAPEEFDGFVGAIAVLMMFGALSEAGVGKYAYKRIPLAAEAEDHNQRHAYVVFAAWMVFFVSSLFVALGILLESSFVRGAVEMTSVTAVLFIPAIAGCGVAVDLLIASRSAVIGTLIARLMVPLVTLSLTIAGVMSIKRFDGTAAVVCFGIGSSVGLVVCYWLLKGRQDSLGQEPTDTNFAEEDSGDLSIPEASESRKLRLIWPEGLSIRRAEWIHWTYRSLSYFAIGCAVTWLFKAPLVVLHHLPHSAAELGLLAPAFETGCLVLLLSKSADKYYFPMLAVAIDTGDLKSDMKLRRRRQAIVGGAALVFWVIVYQLGDSILSLFGSQFVQSHTALIWVASGACVWTLFSLSPTALLFMRRSKQLAANLLFHSIAMVILIPIAFRDSGNDGVACVFAVCLASAATIAKIQEVHAWKSQLAMSATAVQAN